MNIEKLPAGAKAVNSHGMARALLELPKGQCVRFTTAREGRNLPGLSTALKRHKLRLRLKSDGDDILAWTEPL